MGRRGTLYNPAKEALKYGTNVTMTVTNLQSLASSATAGWQSDRVVNSTGANYTDYQILVRLPTANTVPANDKAMYVYMVGWYYDGSTWYPSVGGTVTAPSGTQGTYTIASPNNLRLLGVLNYTTQNMTVQDTFLLSNAFGTLLPAAWSLVIINFSGAALSTGCMVNYIPLSKQSI